MVNCYTEGSPSGLWRTLGKRVGRKSSRVRIPLPPPENIMGRIIPHHELLPLIDQTADPHYRNYLIAAGVGVILPTELPDETERQAFLFKALGKFESTEAQTEAALWFLAEAAIARNGEVLPKPIYEWGEETHAMAQEILAHEIVVNPEFSEMAWLRVKDIMQDLGDEPAVLAEVSEAWQLIDPITFALAGRERDKDADPTPQKRLDEVRLFQVEEIEETPEEVAQRVHRYESANIGRLLSHLFDVCDVMKSREAQEKLLATIQDIIHTIQSPASRELYATMLAKQRQMLSG